MNVGVALNPLVIKGQLQGVRHGVEHATGADGITDKATGKPLFTSWIEYKVPTMLDYVVDPLTTEVPAPSHEDDFPVGCPVPEEDSDHFGLGRTPFGALAIGEGPNQAGTASVANAIYNATGVWLKKTPYTPDKILKALGKI